MRMNKRGKFRIVTKEVHKRGEIQIESTNYSQSTSTVSSIIIINGGRRLYHLLLISGSCRRRILLVWGGGVVVIFLFRVRRCPIHAVSLTPYSMCPNLYVNHHLCRLWCWWYNQGRFLAVDPHQSLFTSRLPRQRIFGRYIWQW